MNNKRNQLLLVLALTVGCAGAARASESDDVVTKAVKVPVTVSALVAGMAVGTPIAVVHDTLNDYSSARDAVASQFGGQSPDPCQYFVADIVALPAGLASGLLNGTYHGVTNAVDNCREKPFSAESFCMKDSCFDDK
jgi:hypothetical protein